MCIKKKNTTILYSTSLVEDLQFNYTVKICSIVTGLNLKKLMKTLYLHQHKSEQILF